jgi:uncharacterized protein
MSRSSTDQTISPRVVEHPGSSPVGSSETIHCDPHYRPVMSRSALEAAVDRMHATLGAFYAGRADRSAVEPLFTADVAWHVPGASPIAGDHLGIDQVLGYFAHRREIASGTFQMHPRETLTGDGNHVGVLTDGTATIGGVPHRWSTLGLYRIVGDRIAECWLLPLDPPGFDAVWSAQLR